MPLFLLNPLYKYLAIVLAVLAVIGGLFYSGVRHANKNWEFKMLEKDKEIAELRIKQNEVTIKTETKYIDRIKEVKVKGDTIIEYVPQYITAKNDAACIIPNGFVSLSNAAMQNRLPEPATTANEEPSGVSLTEVSRNTVRNYTTCYETREQVIGLQNWIMEQSKLNQK
jgi:hypothetical protein